MEKNIIIIGGGGFAIECHNYVMHQIECGEPIKFKGFTAVGKRTLSNYNLDHLYLGDYDKIDFGENDYFVIGIGTPAIRKKVYEEFKARGMKFYTLICPGVRILDMNLAGTEANIFCPCSGGAMLRIGNGNLINSYSGIGHDAEIGNFNVVSSFCDITGGAKMGDLNFLGSHAVLLPKAKIGSGNKIAAGSIVYKGCKDNCVMQGNPALKIADVEDLL